MSLLGRSLIETNLLELLPYIELNKLNKHGDCELPLYVLQ